MATTKKSYGFRLSNQAVKNLDEIHAITGMTKTAAVEFALAQMRTNLKGEVNDMNIETKQQALEAFRELYVGHIERLHEWPEDALVAMVTELKAAQDAGQLDLETDAGLLLLQTIVERHEPAQ